MGLAGEGVDGPVEGGEGGAVVVERDGGGEVCAVLVGQDVSGSSFSLI